MIYYKILKDGVVVDVNNVFLCWQKKHQIMIVCEPEKAQFIQKSDQSEIYRVDWLNPVPPELEPKYQLVEAEPIPELEYLLLRDLLDNDKQIDFGGQTDEISDVADDATSDDIQYLRSLKIKSLSKACNAEIVAGFFCTLSDGIHHHFGWTLEDQANFTSRMIQIMSGMIQTCDYYDYDGRCLSLTAEDMQMIASVADVHASYYRAYFHCLVMLVSDLEDAESVWGVEWGIPVPHKYQSEAFQKYASLIGGGVYEPSEAD